MLTLWRRAGRVLAMVMMLWLATGMTMALPAHAAVDVFGQSDDGGAASGVDAPAPLAATPPGDTLPEPLRSFMAVSVRWQGELNARLQDALDDIRDAWDPQADDASRARGWGAILAIVLASFLYGVLHAVGPGHGKLVVGTYLGSHRARWQHAAWLSGWAALAQALCAIGVVAGLGWVVGAGLGHIMTQAARLETVSYGALCVAGLWTLWSVLTRRDCCEVATKVTLVPRTRGGRLAVVADDKREGESGGSAYLGARLGTSQRKARFTSVASDERWVARQIFAAGLAVGIRPCIGAVFVLLTAMANGIFLVGVAATLAMAVGVAITVFAVGIAGLGLNRWLTKRLANRERGDGRVRRWLAVAGALLIVVFSALQLTLLAGGWIQPSLI